MVAYIDSLVVYQFSPARGDYVPVPVADLTCEVCGATARTDEPGRGIYVDTVDFPDTGERPVARCRCGAIYFAEPTEAKLRQGTLDYIARLRETTVREEPGVVLVEGRDGVTPIPSDFTQIGPETWAEDAQMVVLHRQGDRARLALFATPTQYRATLRAAR